LNNTIIDPRLYLLSFTFVRDDDCIPEPTSGPGLCERRDSLPGTNRYRFLETQDCHFINNIFYWHRAPMIKARGSDPNTDINAPIFGCNSMTTPNPDPCIVPAEFFFSNNLWYAADDPGMSAPTPDASGLPATFRNQMIGSSTNSVVGTDGTGMPYYLFVVPLDENCSLHPGSRAIGRGISTVWYLDADFMGNAYNYPPSIGAREI
jgi:hypothetical protein